MAKNSIRDYSATNSSNTDIQSIDISEGCSPAGINNAIREVMADLKDVSTGAVALESPAFDSASLTGDLTFGDNDKAIFGDGNDLQIYHNGTSASYITDQGTGNLVLGGDSAIILQNAAHNANMLDAYNGGRVGLYHAGNLKLATTATGVDITGTVTADGLTVSPSSGAAIGTVKAIAGQSAYVSIRGNNTTFLTDSFDITQLSNGTAEVMQRANYPLIVGTNNTERMRIDSSGRILCGTTDTDVFNNTSGNGINIKGSAGAIEIANTSGETLYLNRMGTDGRVVNIRKSGTFIGGIDVTTSAVSYNTSSDYRLKENVTATWDATTRLKQLNPVRFNFIADADTTVDGFLAHEVQDIVPEAITGTKDGMRDEEYEVTPAVVDEDGNEVTPAVMGTRSVPDYQGIDQSKLVPLLVKTIQELEARITALEAN